MRRYLIAVLLIVFWASSAIAELTIKGETKVGAYKLVRLSVEGAPEDAGLIWDFDEDKIDAQEAGNKLVFVAPPGTYRIKVRSVVTKEKRTIVETARVTVVIERSGPDPNPPPPPGPVDELVRKLKAGYLLDTDSDKAGAVNTLAQVYLLGAEAIRRNKPATGKTLWDALSAAATAAGITGKLPNTQKAVQSELQQLGLKLNDKLDDAGREKVAQAIEKVGKALLEVTK